MFPTYFSRISAARFIAITLAGIALSGLGCLRAAVADSVTDPLDSWTMVEAHTPGLVIDDTNPVYFYKDTSRIKNADGSSLGSFYYHRDGITSFAAFVYFWNNLGVLEVYCSPDNVTWAPVKVSHTDLTPSTDSGFNGWVSTRIMADLPEGTNYLAFTLRGDPAHVWTPQVGQVAMEVSKTATSGPAGLTVVAAGGKASLAWYPIKGAVDYTVKRRPASSKQFQTVAAGIKANAYTDEGLKNDTKYYYAVTATLQKGDTGNSEEVLAISKSDTVVLTDPLTDWNLTASHSANLEFDKLVDNVDCVRRSGPSRETFAYNLPGATSFAVNVFSPNADMNNDVVVETSADGTNWSILPTSLKLPAKPEPGLYAAVCAPTGTLPADTNYIRFALGSDGSTSLSPSLGQLRITYGVTGPVKTAAAHGPVTRPAP